MRRLTLTVATGLLLVAGAGPAVGSEAGSDPAAAFDSFEIQAQSQAAAGYLFAVGDEENRLAGARVGVAKPADVYALAAAFQRGLAAGYFYAAVLGRSAAGGAGVAPEPPPGETRGLYPSEPRESTWEGPVTTGAHGPVVDGRSEAKATGAPDGAAALQLQGITVPGQLAVAGGSITSRGGPVDAGVEAESVSALSGVTIGSALRIDTMTSRAYGLVPAAGGDPVGTGSTVIEGASVNGTPVRITDAGVQVGDQTPAGPAKAQLSEQVRQALTADNIEDVRLVEAGAAPQPDGVRVAAGTLRVIYRNSSFGASNPQGFSGGGFEVGGATVSLTARRCTSCAAESQPAPSENEPAATGGPVPAPAAYPTPVVAPVIDPKVDGFTAASTVLRAGPSVVIAPTAPVMSPAPASVTPPQPAATARLVAATSADSAASERDTARWTGALFLVLGSVPLLVVLAFRLARP